MDWEADQLKGMVHSGLGWLLMAQGWEVRVLHYLVEVQPLIGLAPVDCQIVAMVELQIVARVLQGVGLVLEVAKLTVMDLVLEVAKLTVMDLVLEAARLTVMDLVLEVARLTVMDLVLEVARLTVTLLSQ